MLVIVVLWISVCIQFVSVFFALRLIQQIGGKLAWVTLSSAIFLMAVRRSISLSNAMVDYPDIKQNLNTEIVALVISVFILVGVLSISPLFRRLLSSEKKLTEQMQRNQIFLDTNPDAFMLTNIHGQIKGTNKAFRDLFAAHYSPAVTSFVELLSPHQHKEYSTVWKTLLKEKQNRYTFRYIANDTSLNLELNAKLIEIEGEQFIYAFIQDVTEREKMEARLFKQKERAQVTLESIADGVITTDKLGHIHFANMAAEKLLGKSNKELKGQKLKSILCTDCGQFDQQNQPLHKRVKECIRQHKTLTFSNQFIKDKHDQQHCLDVIVSPLKSRDNVTTGAVLILRDVTELRKMEQEINYQATHDPLTSLINRYGFENKLAALFESVANSAKQHALLNISLNKVQLKLLTDSCGYDARDDVFRQVSAILESTVDNEDCVTRVDDTDFRLVIESCSMKNAEQQARHIIQKFLEYRFEWQSNRYELNVCIGIAMLNKTTQSIADILEHAESACLAAKKLGRNHLHTYSEKDALSTQRHGHRQRLQQLQNAIDEDRLVLYKQPICSLGSPAQSDHCEVLIRMLDKDGSIIPPGEFLPVAEQYHLMPVIDRWVVKQTLFLIRDKQLSLINESHLSINLSGQTLGDESFLDEVLVLFKETNVAYDKVCFEITETALISNFSHAQKFITTLRARGCKFSLDDFGSGLSSFTYLKTLSVDYLKIDGSFVVGIIDDEKDFNMVKSIHQIGQFMGMKTVAEFIENDKILECVKEIGIDYGQGYALGKPEAIIKKVNAA